MYDCVIEKGEKISMRKILEIADEQSDWGMREQSVYDPINRR